MAAATGGRGKFREHSSNFRLRSLLGEVDIRTLEIKADTIGKAMFLLKALGNCAHQQEFDSCGTSHVRSSIGSVALVRLGRAQKHTLSSADVSDAARSEVDR